MPFWYFEGVLKALRVNSAADELRGYEVALVVNTNIASMNAQRSLAHSARELSSAMERLSTGKKINSAADDAAGFAIAETMTSQVRGLNMAVKNVNDGLGLAKVIENASNDVTDMLQRVRELAVQAASDTNSTSDRGNLQREARALIYEINRVAYSTQYNGENVLDGSYTDKKVQVGYNDSDDIDFSVGSISSYNLGIIRDGTTLTTRPIIGQEGTVAVVDYNPHENSTGILLDQSTLAATNLVDVQGQIIAARIQVDAGEEHTDYLIAGGFIAGWAQGVIDNHLTNIGNELNNLGYDLDPSVSEINSFLGLKAMHDDLESVLMDLTSGELSTFLNATGLDQEWVDWVTEGRGIDNGYDVMNLGDAGDFNILDIRWNDHMPGYLTVTLEGNASGVSLGQEASVNFAPIRVADPNAPPVEGPVVQTQTLFGIDLVNDASDALNVVTAAIDQVAKQKAELGALQNRFEFTVSNLMNVVEFTSAARSRIQDADFAIEAARLAKAQVLQESGAAMLSQANAAPMLVLSLLEVA